MRIVALADRPPHGDLEALVHRSRAAAVLCLGDLDPAWIEPLERVRVPKLGVYGNHDHEAYMDWYGIEDLHLRAAQVDGVSFSGFEGCVRYKRDGDHMFSQRAARRLVRDLPPATCCCATARRPGSTTTRRTARTSGSRPYASGSSAIARATCSTGTPTRTPVGSSSASATRGCAT